MDIIKRRQNDAPGLPTSASSVEPVHGIKRRSRCRPSLVCCLGWLCGVLVPVVAAATYCYLSHSFGWSQIFFLWAPYWAGPVLTMSGWEVEDGVFSHNDPRVFRHPLGYWAKKLRSGADNTEVTLIYDFVSAAEAAQLRGYLGKELSEQYSGGGEATLSRQESTYADDFAEWAYSYIRMSTGSWVPEKLLNKRLSKRIAKLSGIPSKNCERMYLIKYAEGQQFRAHYDLYDLDPTELFPYASNNRAYTVLLYLSDTEEGGGTIFPVAKPPLEVRTKLGNAIMWRNCINGTLDDVDTRLSDLNLDDEEADHRKKVHCLERDWRSIHAGLPVVKGVKWTATRWCHERACNHNEC